MLKSYTEIPEFVQGQKIYANLREAAKKCQESRERAVTGIVKQFQESAKEKVLEQKKLEELEESLLSEGIHGGKNSDKIMEAIKEQTIHLARIEYSLKSLAKLGYVAKTGIDKRIKSLEFQKSEALGLLEGLDSYTYNKINAAKKKEYDEKIIQIDKEIRQFKEDLKVLASFNTDNKSVAPVGDKQLLIEVNALKEKAVESFNQLEKCRSLLVKRLEANREQIKELKEENFKLEQAVSGLEPDRVGDILAGAELMDLIYPIIDTSEELSRNAGLRKNFIICKIIEMARGYVTK